jgi:hypothetical protein
MLASTLLATLTGNRDLLKQFSVFYEAAMAHGFKISPEGISPENASHNALYEVIMQNRDKFDPGEFTIHTQLPDGASVTTFIPSIASMKEGTHKKVGTTPELQISNAYDTDGSLNTASSNALSQIIKTTVLDNQNPAPEFPGKTAVTQPDLTKLYADWNDVP